MFSMLYYTAITAAPHRSGLTCAPLPTVVHAVPYQIKLPAHLPRGYDYNCALFFERESSIIFSATPATAGEVNDYPNSGLSDFPKVIFYHTRGPAGNVTEGTKNMLEMYKDTQKYNPTSKPTIISLSNGSIIWGNLIDYQVGYHTGIYAEYSHIHGYDAQAGYSWELEGDLPFDELEKVASSLT